MEMNRDFTSTTYCFYFYLPAAASVPATTSPLSLFQLSIVTLDDDNSIIHSQSFTFLVGPSRTNLTIQSGLARHVSKPLDHLMNNGQSLESKRRIATLEEEEVDTFVAFCEYAYTSDYNVPPVEFKSEPHNPNPWMRSDSASSNFVPPRAPTPPTLEGQNTNPFDMGTGEGAEEGNEGMIKGNLDAGDGGADSSTASNERKNKKKKKKRGSQTVMFEEPGNLTPPCTPPQINADIARDTLIDEGETSTGEPGSTEWWEQPAPSDAQEEEDGEFENGVIQSQGMPAAGNPFATQPLTVSRKGGNSWDDFMSLDYVFQPPQALRFTPEVPYLVFHAKVYVFATRYLVPGLAQLSLKKLHCDLTNLSLVAPPIAGGDKEGDADAKLFAPRAQMVLELLHYAYTNTRRVEPVSPASPALRENELRKLASHYAACKVRELALYTPPTSGPRAGLNGAAAGVTLRYLLDNITELASDLVYRMMR
ncbi:hypothetical protein V8E54_009042 [Elaphomyces granulatus]